MDFYSRCNECASATKIDPSIDGGKWNDKKKKEAVKDTKDNHPTIPIFGWKQFDASTLPPLFNYGNIYHWLVESVTEMMMTELDDNDSDEDEVNCATTVKSLKRGQTYVDSNFVREVKIKSSNDNSVGKVYLKCSCDASMKGDVIHTVTILSLIHI